MRYKSGNQTRPWQGTASMPPPTGQARRYTHMHVTTYLSKEAAAQQSAVGAAQTSISLVRPSTSPSTIVGTMTVGLPPTAARKDDGASFGMEPATSQLLKKLGRRSNTFSSLKRPSTSSSADSLPPKQLEPLDRPAVEVMSIEGMQMGEEVMVEPVVAREPPEPSHKARSTSAVGAERHINAAKADLRKERKLELEVKRWQSLLNTTNKELCGLKGTYAILLEETRRGCDGTTKRLRELEDERDQQRLRAVAAEKRADDLARTSEEARESSRINDASRDHRCSVLERANVDLEEKLRAADHTTQALQRGVDELRSELSKAEEKAASSSSSSIEQESVIQNLKRQQRSREQLILQIKAALAEEASTSEKRRQELKETRDTLISKEAAAIDLRNRSALMMEYITKICQPHFAVVKDESLQPVNLSGFQVTQGHVLVPLILLLEGYSLLPAQMRSAIDQKSAQGSGPCSINYSRESNHLLQTGV